MCEKQEFYLPLPLQYIMFKRNYPGSFSLREQCKNTDTTNKDQYKREDTNDQPNLDLMMGRWWGKRLLLLRDINTIRIG
jgi:hypothetical protein